MAQSCSKCGGSIRPGSRFCPTCGSELGAEPEFRRRRREQCRRSTIFCALAIPVGLVFLSFSPATTLIVSGLGAVGLVIGIIRLNRMRGA